MEDTHRRFNEGCIMLVAVIVSLLILLAFVLLLGFKLEKLAW